MSWRRLPLEEYRFHCTEYETGGRHYSYVPGEASQAPRATQSMPFSSSLLTYPTHL